MTDAWYEGNEELLSAISEYCSAMLNNLLRKEADLVYYGSFTRADVCSMKPVEVTFHIAEINRRNKEKQDAIERAKQK